MNSGNLKYPLGEYNIPNIITDHMLDEYINDIASFSNRLRSTVLNLSDTQLDTPYRPEGWTIRQVIHHCADSHMNSIIRFKLALTENNPVIKPYLEAKWAELVDSKHMPIEPSLLILDGVHVRWTALLKSLTKQDLSRTFIHPQNKLKYRLDQNIGLYAWHCNHHLQHIKNIISEKKWL